MLLAVEALDLVALALVDDVLVEVGKEDMLVILLRIASMLDFYLAYHLFHQFVLYVTVQRLDQCRTGVAVKTIDGNPIEFKIWIVVEDGSDTLLLYHVAVRTLALLDSLSVFERALYLTCKAYHFVAVRTLFRVDWDLFANDAR